MLREDNTQSLKQELNEALERKNTVRAFFVAPVFSLLIPVYTLIVSFSGLYGGHAHIMKIWLLVFEVISILMSLAGYFVVSRNDLDWQKDFYRFVYGETMVGLLIFAGFELTVSGSVLLYVFLALFMIAVPVLKDRERKIYLAAYAIGTLISLMVAVTTTRQIIDVTFIAAAGEIIAYIAQGYVCDNERVSGKLRAKTLSSEQDPLTGLLNRRGLERKCRTIWPYCERNSSQIGMIEIDIDFFKKYNDKFGHPAGDKCLRDVATAIRKAARRGTDIVARTGGEEFMVLVADVDEMELVEFALKIRRKIAELEIKSAYAGLSQFVTVSMGASVIAPSKNGSLEVLYAQTDKALYRAKENGRNCVVCNGNIYGRIRNGIGTAISE